MRFAAPLALVILAAACGPTVRPPSPSPRTPPPAVPTPTRFAGSDPKLARLTFAFCLAADKAFTYELPLVEPDSSRAEIFGAIDRTHRLAVAQAVAFRRGGYRALAADIQAWADSFPRVGSAIQRGEDPAAAVNIAVRKLAVVEHQVNCEGDV